MASTPKRYNSHPQPSLYWSTLQAGTEVGTFCYKYHVICDACGKQRLQIIDKQQQFLVLT